jgi:hypothetical protein
MGGLILLVCAVVFLFGLVQWARCGATLWEFVRLSRSQPGNAEDDEEAKRTATKQKNRILSDLEHVADSLLRSSFRILSVLALTVWLFVVVSVIIDALGLDWLDSLSFRANRLWGDPTVRSERNNRNSNGGRGSTLQSLGTNFRRR